MFGFSCWNALAHFWYMGTWRDSHRPYVRTTLPPVFSLPPPQLASAPAMATSGMKRISFDTVIPSLDPGEADGVDHAAGHHHEQDDDRHRGQEGAGHERGPRRRELRRRRLERVQRDG